jgi:hypothetical protein
MTTQLVNSLTVDERIKTQAESAESAAEVLATSNAPQLVSSLTVHELEEVIANVVDARLNSFFNSLNTNGVKKSSEIESNELNSKSQTLSSNNYQDKSESTVEGKKENPWLKIASMHQDNPALFEEVVAYIEANRQNDLEEDLSHPVEENPWLKMAGKYENDPYFDQMLEGIAEYRREQDAELDEYYRQMEIADNNVDSTNLVAEVAAL